MLIIPVKVANEKKGLIVADECHQSMFYNYLECSSSLNLNIRYIAKFCVQQQTVCFLLNQFQPSVDAINYQSFYVQN